VGSRECSCKCFRPVCSSAASLPAFRYPRPFDACIASLDIIVTTTLTHLQLWLVHTVLFASDTCLRKCWAGVQRCRGAVCGHTRLTEWRFGWQVSNTNAGISVASEPDECSWAKLSRSRDHSAALAHHVRSLTHLACNLINNGRRLTSPRHCRNEGHSTVASGRVCGCECAVDDFRHRHCTWYWLLREHPPSLCQVHQSDIHQAPTLHLVLAAPRAPTLTVPGPPIGHPSSPRLQRPP
jgi:hypothetical protein